MKILLAARVILCGVNMAIESLDLAIQAFGTPIYVYHEIVHNKYVVDRFRAKGAVFVDSLRMCRRFDPTLLGPRRIAEIRASLASGGCGDRRHLPPGDQGHLEAVRFAKEGYTILLIGHEGHDEVIGTMGEAPQAIVLVESVEHADRLQFPGGTKLAYLTQTTLSVDDANRIIDRLKSGFPSSWDRRRKTSVTPRKTARKPSARSRRGGPGPGAGQPKQLEQPAAQGDRVGNGRYRAPYRRCRRHR